MRTKMCVLIMLAATQAMNSPALAFSASFKPLDPVSGNGTVDADSSLDTIGPLHCSEGRVLIKQNQITVLSDAADSNADAELSGVVLNCHIRSDGSSPVVVAVAVFTKGYSLPSLDNTNIKDSVLATDGLTRVGRITEVSSNLLRMKTPTGNQIIPTSKITAIKSPRAYAIYLPLKQSSTTPTSTTDAGEAIDSSSQIVFEATCPPETIAPTAAHAHKSLHAQLSERHAGKRILIAGAALAAFTACLAIPLGIAFITPRPKSLGGNSGGGSSTGGSGSGN